MGYEFSFGGRLTPAVRWLIGINTIIFLFTYFFDIFMPGVGGFIVGLFGLTPGLAVFKFYLWQLVTYLFLHAGIIHILFNMLFLWMFGGPLENIWGTRKFLFYYFVTGIGAGICYIIFAFTTGLGGTTIGASGAIFGLLLAFGYLFPDSIILMFFIFPMKMKYAVIIFAAIEFLMSFHISGVAHIAHLGGMIFGLIYLRNQPYFDGFLTYYERTKEKRVVKVMKKKKEDFDRTQREADKILEKISIHGMDKITPKEKEILDRASKLLKEKEQNIINLDDYR